MNHREYFQAMLDGKAVRTEKNKIVQLDSDGHVRNECGVVDSLTTQEIGSAKVLSDGEQTFSKLKELNIFLSMYIDGTSSGIFVVASKYRLEVRCSLEDTKLLKWHTVSKITNNGLLFWCGDYCIESKDITYYRVLEIISSSE